MKTADFEKALVQMTPSRPIAPEPRMGSVFRDTQDALAGLVAADDTGLVEEAIIDFADWLMHGRSPYW